MILIIINILVDKIEITRFDTPTSTFLLYFTRFWGEGRLKLTTKTPYAF